MAKLKNALKQFDPINKVICQKTVDERHPKLFKELEASIIKFRLHLKPPLHCIVL